MNLALPLFERAASSLRGGSTLDQSLRDGGLFRGLSWDEAGEEFAAAADVEAFVELLHVDVHGVLADGELVGDLLFAVAGKKAVKRLRQARREARVVKLERSVVGAAGVKAAKNPTEVGDETPPSVVCFVVGLCGARDAQKRCDVPKSLCRIVHGLTPL